jgi:peptide/nickel transport system permease protein
MKPAEILLVALVVVGIGGALLAAPSLAERAQVISLDMRLSPPGEAAMLGTDQLGRDIAARVIAGAPWSLAVAGGATLIALVLGTIAGLAAAEGEGWPRRIILQLVTLVLSFPGLVAAVAAVAVLGQSSLSVLLVLGLLTWTLFARVIYAEAASVRSRDYVTAARLGGVGQVRLMLRHVVPAIAPSLIAMTVFHFADMLVAAARCLFWGSGRRWGRQPGAPCSPKAAPISIRRRGCSWSRSARWPGQCCCSTCWAMSWRAVSASPGGRRDGPDDRQPAGRCRGPFAGQ